MLGTYMYPITWVRSYTFRPPQCRQELIFHNHFFRPSCPMYGWMTMMLRSVG